MYDISVIVPVYNIDETYLDTCVNSLLHQTHSNIEIIIINDGSTLYSSTFFEKYSNKDRRIKVINQKNQGVSVARNRGIKEASSDWITFVDPDDWVSEQMCEKLLKSIGKNPFVDILIFTYADCYTNREIPRYWGNSKEYIFNKSEHKDLQLGLLDETQKKVTTYFGAVWGNLYKKQFLIKNNIEFNPKLRKSQDTLFNLYAVNYANQIKYLNEVLYYYRHNNQSVCYRYNQNIDSILTTLIEEINFFLLDNVNRETDFEHAFYYKVLVTTIEILKLNYFHNENNLVFSEKEFRLNNLLNMEIYYNVFNNIELSKLSLKKKIIVILIKSKHFHMLNLLFKLQTKYDSFKNKTF